MPRSIETTCDVCGERAKAYPSFFELRNVNEGYFVNAGGGLGRSAPVQREVDVAGCLRYDLRVYLCQEHFKSLEAACEQWFAGVQKEQQVVSR